MRHVSFLKNLYLSFLQSHGKRFEKQTICIIFLEKIR